LLHDRRRQDGLVTIAGFTLSAEPVLNKVYIDIMPGGEGVRRGIRGEGIRGRGALYYRGRSLQLETQASP